MVKPTACSVCPSRRRPGCASTLNPSMAATLTTSWPATRKAEQSKGPVVGNALEGLTETRGPRVYIYGLC